MEIITLPLDTAFSVSALTEALNKMRYVIGKEVPIRLIISNVYPQYRILEIVSSTEESLNIPFEISYSLPANAWMLVEDQNKAIFYSPGA